MAGRWGLLTNHALVLIHVIEHPRSTLRDIADAVAVTERAAQSLLRALEEDNIIARRRVGRRNVYTVDIDALMSHRTQGTYSIAQIANALFALSGRIPGTELPPGMQLTGAGGPLALASAPDVGTTPVIPGTPIAETTAVPGAPAMGEGGQE